MFNPPSISYVYRSAVPVRIRSHIIFGDPLSVARTISNGLPDPTLPNPHLRFAPGAIIVHPPRSVNLYDPFQFHSLHHFPD